MSGLKSLQDKLSNIETKLSLLDQSNSSSGTNFVSKTINTIQQTKSSNQILDLNKINTDYLNGLKQLTDISNPINVIENFTQIVEFTIKFVEKKIKKIAKIVQSVITSNFKLVTAVNFITTIVGDLLPNSMIVQTINHFVELVFNKNNKLKFLKMKK